MKKHSLEAHSSMFISQWMPVKPGMHLHWYRLIPSIHVAPFRHGSKEINHPIIYGFITKRPSNVFFCEYYVNLLEWHSFTLTSQFSPDVPGLQRHRYVPTKSSQCPSNWHGSIKKTRTLNTSWIKICVYLFISLLFFVHSTQYTHHTISTFEYSLDSHSLIWIWQSSPV